MSWRFWTDEEREWVVSHPLLRPILERLVVDLNEIIREFSVEPPTEPGDQ